MKFWICLFVFICVWSVTIARAIKRNQKKPPTAKFRYQPKIVQKGNIAAQISAWKPESGTNIWEESGLYEGDIMVYQTSQVPKNGLLDPDSRWPNATVPFYIDDEFSDEELLKIYTAFDDFHKNTCIRFRPYEKTDEHWIDIKPSYQGCWSSVGMKRQGQVVNLGSEKCLRHGVICHELMHALGFFHQQSAANRDDFIQINWDNIRRGREHNFNKYNETTVTDFNIMYDYDSVMHYSAKAFSKNGENTIETLFGNATLGQRVGFSEKDIEKINLMYGDISSNETINIFDYLMQHHQIPGGSPEQTEITETNNGFSSVIQFFESLLGIQLWQS